MAYPNTVTLLDLYTYQGSYPFLRIARAFHLTYGLVLAVDEWMRAGEPEIEEMDPRYQSWLHKFFVWQHHWPNEMHLMMNYMALAQQHFYDQQAGRRDMDGKHIVEPL